MQNAWLHAVANTACIHAAMYVCTVHSCKTAFLTDVGFPNKFLNTIAERRCMQAIYF